MSGFVCPDCGNRYDIFGSGGAKQRAAELEIPFLGEVPITPYKTPGTQAFADTVLPFVQKASIMILANHGTVSLGETIERAYWWTEILDAYCRILLLAKDLGKVNYFTEAETRELLALKQQWGFKDPRLEKENCDIRGNDIFGHTWKASGVERRAFEPPPAMPPKTPTDSTSGAID